MIIGITSQTLNQFGFAKKGASMRLNGATHDSPSFGYSQVKFLSQPVDNDHRGHTAPFKK